VKFLHTADWHVGKSLKGHSRLEEQRQVLAEIVGIARDHDVDAVLIAGDVYDTAAPGAEAQRLVNHTLLTLARDGREVVVIAGNHDHANTFEALRPLMKAAGIEYAGRVRATAQGGVHTFTAKSTGEQVVVVLLPFLSRRYAYGAEELVTGSPSENAGHYDEAVRTVLRELCSAFRPGAVNLVMAHLTCTSGTLGGGEQSRLRVPRAGHGVSCRGPPCAGAPPPPPGDAGQLPGAPFGRPLAIDFGEQENTSVVCIVEASPGTPASVVDVPVQAGRRLRTVRGTVAGLAVRAEEYANDFLRVVVMEPTRAGLRDEVLEILPNALEIRIDPSFIQARTNAPTAQAAQSPRELFAAYCAQVGIADPRVSALFDELSDQEAR
jgi:exonuclease SbcD